ncbi:MAG: DNA adenine methylase [Euryarchaeota archaeon]|nr:DNA adenine methylase [Euryarchaeota archaeon]
MPRSFRSNGQLPRPFIKWAGGKGNIIGPYEEKGLLSLEFKDYYEPFLGGGAMFFHLWNKKKIRKAYLSDINKDLIDTYITIKEHLNELLDALKVLQNMHSKEEFYKFRAEFNELKTRAELSEEEIIRKSALFIYLNKTCFNGLYRENKKGEFNVPFGRYKNPKIYDEENLRAVSKALQNAELRVCDFEDAVKNARAGDFVYFDPPYMPISPTSNFTSYHQKDFTIDEQKRLAKVIENLIGRGVYVLLSNAYHPDIRALYEHIPGINFFEILAPRYINSNGKKRGPVKEYAISNYLPGQKTLTLSF